MKKKNLKFYFILFHSIFIVKSLDSLYEVINLNLIASTLQQKNNTQSIQFYRKTQLLCKKKGDNETQTILIIEIMISCYKLTFLKV